MKDAPPDGIGVVVYAFAQYMAQQPHWDLSMSIAEVYFQSCVSYYFVDAAHMYACNNNAEEAYEDKKDFLAPPSLRI